MDAKTSSIVAYVFDERRPASSVDELRARGHHLLRISSIEDLVVCDTWADVLLLHVDADTMTSRAAELERHCESLGKRGTGVIVLAGRPGLDVKARVKALRAGADLVLDDPMPTEELEAHLRVLRRRSESTDRYTLRHGPLVLDLLTATAFDERRQLDLSPLQFQMLAYLIAHAGQAVSGAELRERLFRGSYDRNSAIVRNQVRLLRRRLGRLAPWLVTVRGHGYRLARD